MEVTAQTFPYHLPKMLEDLASSNFVAIDFEFSGITNTFQGRAGPLRSLQQRYQEVVAGADKYQILQVGMTFCHEDAEGAKYTLKPYNLYLSPIIDRKLEVDRDWSFQSSAIEFLLGNRFNMDSLYKVGVPYISRDEEAKAIKKAVERQSQTSNRLDVKETDHESLAFLQLARNIVDNWLALGDKRDDYLNIPPPTRQIELQALEGMPSALNRFQKRLVHQLIEVEYPGFVTIGRPSWVQIIEYDEDREKMVRDNRVQWMRDRVWKETGFRWVAEALAGGDLSHLGPQYFHTMKANTLSHGQSLEGFADQFKEQLKSHRPALVGHNLFTDLIYFFRCFFGSLPERVEDFQSMVHEHFPVLIDTKYLATHDCGSINPTSSLQEINDSLLKIPKPTMSIHQHFARYNNQKVDHEAGYDSLLTAQVFIKLSAQLGGSQATTNELDNQLSQLQVDRLGNEEILGEHTFADEIRMANKGHLIPRVGSQFWTVYGNRLRVFGTHERVCQIGS